MVDPISLLRLTNSLLGALAPELSARVARHAFTTPHRHPTPEREAAAERSGERLVLRSGASALRWGRGPRILALHGWEGRATQWGPLAERASMAGYEVLALDAPAHGRSPGRRTHIGELVRALHQADDQYGPFAAVVGHSLGGAAAALALASGLRAERAVLIASPSAIVEALRRFAAHVRLSPRAERAFFEQMELLVGQPAEDLDVAALALPTPTLIIHSRDDREVPFGEAQAIARAWPSAELLALEGLGHRRILRDANALAAALTFASASTTTLVRAAS